MEMEDGTRYAASAGAAFTAEQSRLLQKHNIHEVRWKRSRDQNKHAEVQLIEFVRRSNESLFPVGRANSMGVSKDICSKVCQPAIAKFQGGGKSSADLRSVTW